MERLRILSHHIYELKKGLRSLILFTTAKENRAAVVQKLKANRIGYLICAVSKESSKINVFFGNPTCIDVLKRFGKRHLKEFSPEEDFILGTMLGYDRLKQCARYLRVRQRRERARRRSEAAEVENESPDRGMDPSAEEIAGPA